MCSEAVYRLKTSRIILKNKDNYFVDFTNHRLFSETSNNWGIFLVHYIGSFCFLPILNLYYLWIYFDFSNLIKLVTIFLLVLLFFILIYFVNVYISNMVYINVWAFAHMCVYGNMICMAVSYKQSWLIDWQAALDKQQQEYKKKMCYFLILKIDFCC